MAPPKVAPTVEPETRRFLEALNAAGGTPIHRLSPPEARKVLSDVQASAGVELQPAELEDRTIPGGPDGEGVSIRIVRPEGAADELPVIMHFHGGGWVLGGKDTHDRLVRELANGAQAAVVFVDYALAPEARYPTQLEQCYAATAWIAENGASLGLDPSRLVLCGDSVGGNLVAAVARLAKERGGPAVALQVMFYPVTDARFDTGSYDAFAEGHFLTRDGMRWFWDNYLPDEKARADSHASPLRSSLEELRGLPRALVLVGENDVLRDEGEAYARKLAEAGVRVEAARFVGTMHDFVMLNPIADTPAPRAALRLATSTMRQVFASMEARREAGRAAEREEAGAIH